MGYAFGKNAQSREIGYGVEAVCDLEGCNNKINRGLAYCCGGMDGVEQTDDTGVPCGGYFCAAHLYMVPRPEGDSQGAGEFVCDTCYDKLTCEKCSGKGHDEEGEYCTACDSLGAVLKSKS